MEPATRLDPRKRAIQADFADKEARISTRPLTAPERRVGGKAILGLHS